MFDVNQLLQTTLDQSMSTELINVPEGDWRAVTTKMEGRSFSRSDGSGDGYTLNLTWEIDDPSGQVKSVTKRDKNMVRQQMFLDVTESGTIDLSEGKNVDLGRLRAVFNQNNPGVPWSFPMLVGQAGLVSVRHRTADDGKVYAEVKKVGKIS